MIFPVVIYFFLLYNANVLPSKIQRYYKFWQRVKIIELLFKTSGLLWFSISWNLICMHDFVHLCFILRCFLICIQSYLILYGIQWQVQKVELPNSFTHIIQYVFFNIWSGWITWQLSQYLFICITRQLLIIIFIFLFLLGFFHVELVISLWMCFGRSHWCRLELIEYG